MRLVDLNPKWVSCGERRGVGLTFTCPVHGGDCRLAALFANPTDGGPPIDEDGPERRDMALGWHLTCRWTRTGETFETMSLSPSLNFHVDNVTHWHGFITNGEVR